MNELLRRIPKVDDLLRSPALAQTLAQYGEHATTEAVRAELDTLRQIISTDNIKTVWVGVDNRRAADFDFYYPSPAKTIADELAQKLFSI